jgi:hypothetical protein
MIPKLAYKSLWYTLEQNDLSVQISAIFPMRAHIKL